MKTRYLVRDDDEGTFVTNSKNESSSHKDEMSSSIINACQFTNLSDAHHAAIEILTQQPNTHSVSIVVIRAK